MDLRQRLLLIGSGNSKRSPKPSKYENHGVKEIWRVGLWTIGMLLDLSVVYIFFIGDDRKCIQVDKSSGTTICVVHALVDIISIIFYMNLELRDDLQEGARRLHICSFMICMFPYSLVMVILILRTNAPTVLYGVIPLLVQASLRLIQLLKLSAKAIPPSASFGQWALKFFYSYMCLGLVVGAMWYVGAIYTEVKCWQKACRNHNSGCTHRDFHDRFLRCNGSLKAYKTVNDFCSRNTTKYGFGIFRDAHQSGIMEMRGSLQKILYSFRWAMQSISGFGKNLEAVGSDVLGNFFVIFIVLAAVTFFHFLLRQMQVYMQSNAERGKERSKKLRETEKTTKQLCLELLKKVEEFQSWDDASLDDFYAYLKPAFYSEHTDIIRENESVDKMIFVMQGKLWVYSSDPEKSPINSVRTDDLLITATTTESLGTILNDQRYDHLNEVVFCGELVDWLRTNLCTSKLPVSKRTIQAVTKVEAFILMANDLKNIFIKHKEAQIVAQAANTSNAVPADQEGKPKTQ